MKATGCTFFPDNVEGLKEGIPPASNGAIVKEPRVGADTIDFLDPGDNGLERDSEEERRQRVSLMPPKAAQDDILSMKQFGLASIG